MSDFQMDDGTYLGEMESAGAPLLPFEYEETVAPEEFCRFGLDPEDIISGDVNMVNALKGGSDYPPLTFDDLGMENPLVSPRHITGLRLLTFKQGHGHV